VVGAVTYYDTGLSALVSRDGHRTIVLIDLAGRRPVPVPDAFRERIAGFQGAPV